MKRAAAKRVGKKGTVKRFCAAKRRRETDTVKRSAPQFLLKY